jgi:hypothetical protein
MSRYVEQARDVLGPLDIAAHPEQGIGDSAEHLKRSDSDSKGN